jgi:hypothetical protein
VGSAIVAALGVAQAQTQVQADVDSDLFDGGVLDASAFADAAEDAGVLVADEPSFTLAIGRSPTQAGFALDIAGGVPHGWAQLTLQASTSQVGSAPATTELVALDSNGAARVLERNYAIESEVLATCTIPKLGASVGSAAKLTATIPAGWQMPNPGLLVAAGDIVITEIMKDPSFVTDANGEWFEVFNRTTAPINVEGWKIKDSGSNSHTIHNTNGVWIPQRSYFVFGVNSTTTTNGGIAVNYKYSSSFTLSNAADDIQLVDPNGVTVDAVAYDDGIFWPDDAGKSLNVNRAMVDAGLNDDGANWCSALTPVSATNTDLATPRRANNVCP